MTDLSQELRAQLDEYRKTAASLREYLDGEKIKEIDDSLRSLEELRISISVFGETHCGKSSLLNALLGYSNADPNRSFTPAVSPNLWSDEIALKNGVQWIEIEGLEVVVYDTPGIAGDFQEHLHIAKEIAGNSDVILFIVCQAPVGDEKIAALQELYQSGKPLVVVINKIDTLREQEIKSIKNDILSKISLKDDMFIEAAAYPINGQLQIDTLAKKIASLVEEQKTGVILKSIETKMTKGIDDAVAEVNKRIEKEKRRQEEEVRRQEKKIARLQERTEGVVDGYAKAAAAAAAIIPFGIDAITSTIVGGGMFIHIANVYDKEIDLKIIASIGKELLEAFTSILFVSGLSLAGYLTITKSLKTNPFTYIAGATIDGIFTYFIISSIGNTFSYYCANDLSWGAKKNASAVLEDYIKNNIDKLFFSKLPDKYKNKFEDLINPDILS